MFVLAHLSDPHLGPLPRAKLRELAGKRAIGFFNWHRNRHGQHLADVLDALVDDLRAAGPDHVAVTGDLVNISLDTEFAPARKWLEQLGSPQQVSVVPGNHDAYVRRAVQHPATHWGDYMRGDGVGVGAPVEKMPPFPYIRRRPPVAIIGLSTAVPTAPFMATGYLGADQLMRLADALALLSHEELFRVVLIHHPPVSMGSRLKQLVDAGQFRRVIAEHGCELILHGHDHVYSTRWMQGPDGRVPALGVPSASATLQSSRGPAGYNLFHITGDSRRWRCEVISRGLRAGEASIAELARAALL